uniref:Uncharacterized protein n=1 Tax=Timema cristinae TaxID=61476 RepID=A0A7R9CFL8_TIMCR|nr:unnamed protein product [Timema cristinae]
MERLLPSEIARLVLGYLEEETEDVAQNFLEKSRFLAECFALAREGIEYTTKPYGKTLKDLLNELCAVHRLVSDFLDVRCRNNIVEKNDAVHSFQHAIPANYGDSDNVVDSRYIMTPTLKSRIITEILATRDHRLIALTTKLPESSAAPIRQCSLVEQITHLIDSTCSGQTLLVSITMPPSQGSSSASTPQSNSVGVPGSSGGRTRSRPPNSSERTKRLALRLHMQDNSEEDTPETVTTAGVEATPSESLPGLSHERSPQISACPREINTPSSGTSDGPRDVSPGDGPRDVSPGGKSVLEAGECSVLGPSSASSTPKHKSSLSKRKGHPTPSKAMMMTPGKNTAQTRARRSLSEEEANDDINLIPQFLKEAFLANNQLQQKLAESINRVIEAETSQTYPTKETTMVAERGAIDMLPSCDTSYEIDNIIRTVVQETEQDPLSSFMDVIPPNTSVEESTTPHKMTPSKSNKIVEGEECGEVPLKQRLRSSAKIRTDTSTGDWAVTRTNLPTSDWSAQLAYTPPNRQSPCRLDPTWGLTYYGFYSRKNVVHTLYCCHWNKSLIAEDGEIEARISSYILQQKRLKHRLDYGSIAREDTSPGKNKLDSILEESRAASGPDKLQAGSSLNAAEDGGGTISLKDQNDAAIQCIIDANIMCSDGRMISPGTPTVTQQQHILPSHVFPSAQPQQMFSQQDYHANLPQVEQHTPSMVSFDTSLGQLVSEACADMPEMSDLGSTELNKGTCLTNSMKQNLTLVTPSSSQLTEQYIVLERSSFSHQLDGNITVNTGTAILENPLVLASSVATRVEGAALSKQNTTHRLPDNAMPDDQVITESQLMNMPTLILCGNENILSIPQNKVCPTTHVVPFKIIPAKKKKPIAIAPSKKKRRTQNILPKPTFTFTADNQHPLMSMSQNTMTSSIHPPKNITSSEIGKLALQPPTSRIANSTKLLAHKSIPTQLQTKKLSKPIEDIASCSTANTLNVVHISDTNTCTLSLPKILDSPLTHVPSQSITEGIPGASEGELQDKEEEKREQLLGALHLTQSPYKNRAPSTPNSSGKTPAGNDSVRLLSPQLMTLVNISKTNISNGTGGGKSPIDKRKEGSDGKISEATRETPNNLTESQQETVNPRRLSLSTPRRRRNHIRALDFSTPPKFSLTPNMRKSFTSPKASGKKISPRSAKPIRRASLFKSPSMVVNSQKNQCLFKAPAENPTSTVLFKSPENSPTGNSDTNTLLTKDTLSTKVDAFCPIATRSPVPSLSGGWDKVTGAGLIFEDSSQKLLNHPSTESGEQGSNNNLVGIGVSSSRKNEYVESTTNNEDKLQIISSPAANKLGDMWDADLRAHLVPNYTEPEPPIKTTVHKLVKRSVQKPVKRSVQKPVKRSVQKPVKRSVQKPVKRSVKSKANKAAKRNSRKVTAEEVRKLEEGLNIMSDFEGSDGIETIEDKTNSLKSQITKSPVLDTPMKKNLTEPGPHISDISSLIPLTPRVLSPRAVEDTPITKFLKEQICSYESSFDTPSFPRTPNVPLTPRSSPQGNIEDQEYSTRPTDYSSCSSYYKPNEEIDPPNSSLEQVLIEECCRIEENTDVNKAEKSNEQTKEKEIPTVSSQENKHICDSESLEADNLKSPPVLNECCDVKESNIQVSPKAKEREEIDKVLEDKPHGQSSSSIKTNIITTLVEVSALVESRTDKSDGVSSLGIDKQNASSVKSKSNQVTENCLKETSGESKSLPNIAPDYENKNKPITEMVISDKQQKTTNDKPSERCARTSLYYIKETKKIYSPKRSYRRQCRTKDRNSKKNVLTIIQDVISPEDKTKLISGFLNKARAEYAISLASSKDNSHNIELDKNEQSKIKDGSKPQLNESKTNRLTFDNVTGSPLLKSAKSRRLFEISSDSSDNSNGGASLQIQTSSSSFSSLESVNYEIHKSKHKELPLKQMHSNTNEASSSKSILKKKDDEKEHSITPALKTLNYEASSSTSFEGIISEETNLDSPSPNTDTITSTIASIVQETAQNVDKNEVFKTKRDKELLSELEDKRTRTLAKLKNPQISKVKASISKSTSENPPVVEAPLLEDKQTEISKICSKGEECHFKEMRHPDEQSTLSTVERFQQQKDFQNLMKTPLKTPQSSLLSSPEEFPSLHLSSDDEVEGTSQTSGGLTPLSRVELQLAKIHGEKFKRNKMLQTPNKLKDTFEISNATNISLKEDTQSYSSPTTKNNIILECTNMTTLEMNDSVSDTKFVSSASHLQNILTTSPIKLKSPKKTLSKKLNKSIPISKKSSKKLESKSTSSKSSISSSKASKVCTKVIGNDIPLLKKATNGVNQTSTLFKSTLQEECKNSNELNNSTSKKLGVRHSDLSDQTHLSLINYINESCTLSEKQVITLEETCVSENNPTPNKPILQEERSSYLETDVIQKENIIERFGGEEKCSSDKLGGNEEISSEKVIEVSEILGNAPITSSIDHSINHQMSAQTEYVPNETKSLSTERKHQEKNKSGSSKQNDMAMKDSSKKQNVDLEKKTNVSTKLNDVLLTENTPKNNIKLNNTSNDSKLEDSSSSKTENKLIHKTKTSISKTKQSPLKILDSQPMATHGKTKRDFSKQLEPDLKPTKVIENSLTQKREHFKSLMTSKDSDKNIEIVSEVPFISEKASSNCEKTITVIYKGDGPLCKHSVSPDSIENCSISTVITGEDKDMVVTARVTPFFELFSLMSQQDIPLKDNELNKAANTRKHSFDTKLLIKMDESLLHKSINKKQIETSRTGLRSICVKKLDIDKQESCKSHLNYSQSASKRSNVNRAFKKSNKMISPLSILDKEYEWETRDIKNTRRSDHDRPPRKYEEKSKPRGPRYAERESRYRGPRRRTSSPYHRQRSWHRDLHRRSRTPTYRRVQKGSAEDLTEGQPKIVYSRSSCERHIFQDSFTSPDRMKPRVTPAIKTRHKKKEEDLNVDDSHSAHSYTGDSVADIEELFQLQKSPFHPERSPFRLQDSPSDREEDDDLMTYALVGSHSKHKPSRSLPVKKSQCNDTLVRSSGTKTDQASTSASVRDERQSLPPKKRKASIEAAAPPASIDEWEGYITIKSGGDNNTGLPLRTGGVNKLFYSLNSEFLCLESGLETTLCRVSRHSTLGPRAARFARSPSLFLPCVVSCARPPRTSLVGVARLALRERGVVS